MTFIYIFIGGGIGSIFRYLIGLPFQKMSNQFPLGTLFANILAATILGLFFYTTKDKNIQQWIPQFVLIGICGGLSTFSTFSHETANLIHQGDYLFAGINMVISLVLSIGLIYFLKFNQFN